MKRGDVEAYLSRDWARAEAAKQAHWSRRRRGRALAEAARVMAELRAHAVTVQPDYPTPSDREADLETHRRVAAALARCPRARR